MNSFLIKPIQRICKYPLLLRELLKHTPEDHADYTYVKAALEKVHAIVEEVNKKKRDSENLQKILEIQGKINNISDMGKALLKPRRQFLMEATFNKISAGNNQERHFFLFTDLILYVSPLILGTQIHALKSSLLNLRQDSPYSRKIYQFKGAIFLKRALVRDVADTAEMQNAFELVRLDGKKKVIKLCCTSPQEKSEWLQAISERIEHYLEKAKNKQDTKHTTVLSSSPTPNMGATGSPTAGGISRPKKIGGKTRTRLPTQMLDETVPEALDVMADTTENMDPVEAAAATPSLDVLKVGATLAVPKRRRPIGGAAAANRDEISNGNLESSIGASEEGSENATHVSNDNESGTTGSSTTTPFPTSSPSDRSPGSSPLSSPREKGTNSNGTQPAPSSVASPDTNPNSNSKDIHNLRRGTFGFGASGGGEAVPPTTNLATPASAPTLPSSNPIKPPPSRSISSPALRTNVVESPHSAGIIDGSKKVAAPAPPSAATKPGRLQHSRNLIDQQAQMFNNSPPLSNKKPQQHEDTTDISNDNTNNNNNNLHNADTTVDNSSSSSSPPSSTVLTDADDSKEGGPNSTGNTSSPPSTIGGPPPASVNQLAGQKPAAYRSRVSYYTPTVGGEDSPSTTTTRVTRTRPRGPVGRGGGQ